MSCLWSLWLNLIPVLPTLSGSYDFTGASHWTWKARMLSVGKASSWHSLRWADPQGTALKQGVRPAGLRKAYLWFWAVAVVITPKGICEVLQNSLGGWWQSVMVANPYSCFNKSFLGWVFRPSHTSCLPMGKKVQLWEVCSSPQLGGQFRHSQKARDHHICRWLHEWRDSVPEWTAGWNQTGIQKADLDWGADRREGVVIPTETVL